MRTCDISVLVLRGGGESEDEVTEMISSGSLSQFFLLRCGGNSDSEGEGRKRGVFDVRRGIGIGGDEDEVGREAACPPKTAFVLTHRKAGVSGRGHTCMRISASSDNNGA